VLVYSHKPLYLSELGLGCLSFYTDSGYNKFYIGLAKDGQPDNFVQFRPQKNAVRLEARLSRTEEIESILESAGLDMLDYDGKWRRYRIRLQAGDIKKHADVLQQLIERAHGEAHGGTGY
jgi:hypothetical protein